MSSILVRALGTLLVAVAALGCEGRTRRPVADPAAPAGLVTSPPAGVSTPDGWSASSASDVITLVDPDRAVTVAISSHQETDLHAAIAAAWRARGGPPSNGEPEALPPQGGWDAALRVSYEAPGRRAPWALARRFGRTTWVAIVDGEVAALDRRAAQIETAVDSLRPPGMKEEAFVGPARALDPARVAAIDAFAAEALAKLQVPGAAVAVLHRGAVVYERALGVREIGRSDPVTSKTLFLVGSVTKPMTTMMQAALVDARVLEWTTPVTRLLPDFALGDPALTRSATLWHMSCACTGMPRQDLENLFEYAGVTPEARLASMKTMTPTTGLGETFQYSNLMVSAGGFAAAHAFAPALPLGEAYAAAMRAKVFEPIGMTATTLDFAAVARADHASPHALSIDGATRAMPLAIERDVLPIAPAGAAFTNLADFERYALVELGAGAAPDGRRIVSAQNATARHTVRVRSGARDGYGLGLDVSEMGGQRTLGHDGGAFGYGATMLLFPEHALGILILTNVRNGGPYAQLPFNEVVARRIVELVFDGAKHVAAPSLAHYVKRRGEGVKRALAGLDRAPDAAWLATLAGTYRSAALGRVVIAGATLDAGEWRTTFGRRADPGAPPRLVLLDPPFAGVEIALSGDPARPTLVLEEGQARHVFQR